MRERRHTLNGGFTGAPAAATPIRRTGYNDAKTLESENSNTNNVWSATRTSSTTNNNKNNSNYVRPVAALGEWETFYKSVIEAFKDCLRHKLSKKQGMEYLPVAAEDIPLLAWDMWTMCYEPSVSICFMVLFPKLREVFAAAFRDRIVHHWICLRLSPVYEYYCWRLGNPTHACRVGFGNRTAIAQVEGAMYDLSGHYRRPCWIYKGDIVSFFMSIDKAVMWRIMRRVIEANRERWTAWEYDLLLYLTEITIMHCPHKNCIVKSDISLWQQIDPDKSMFYVAEGKAMPIGNLTTQLFAGFYMLGMIKFTFGRFRHYLGADWRNHASLTVSVDDYAMVCDDLKVLKLVVKEVEAYLRDELLLKCHSEQTYLQPVSHGVKFLGKWLKPHRKYTITRTVNRFRAAVRKSIMEAEKGLSPIGAESILASLNSYLGILKGTRSHRIIEQAFAEVTPAWKQYFEYRNYKITLKQWTQKNFRSHGSVA